MTFATKILGRDLRSKRKRTDGKNCQNETMRAKQTEPDCSSIASPRESCDVNDIVGAKIVEKAGAEESDRQRATTESASQRQASDSDGAVVDGQIRSRERLLQARSEEQGLRGEGV